MKKLNICYLTQQYGNFVSGVGTYSTNLINSAVEQGHKVSVICPKEKKREFDSPIVKLIEVKRKKWDPSHGNWFTLSFQFSLELKKLIRKRKIDIIHFTDARECFFCNFLGKNKNILTIGTMHDYIFAEADHNPFFYKKLYNDWIKRYAYYNSVKVLEKRCLKKLDFIICVSSFVKEKLVSCYKIKEKNTAVVYNGINFATDGSGNKKKERAILIIGNNLQRKGIITLFKAFLLIKEKYSD
ncbi:MAG: glycosyltransferase family 4 protein, partial [Candidatus Pacebacteria bacterium]|nr:glycosyltransferase family 4 protein [Candidatus Paceibacterota bacterium]